MTEMLTAAREHGPKTPASASAWRARLAGRDPLRNRVMEGLSADRSSGDGSTAGGPTKDGSGWRVDLLPAVDRNVIPRLHAALQEDLRRPRHPLISATGALDHEIKDLAERMLRGDLDGACLRVDTLRNAGRSLESIHLKLLAPTACHLRDLWSDDLCGLADMTFALCNLQSLLRHYAQDFYAEASRPESGLRVLLVAPSNEGAETLTPMFGLLLMAQFFRRDGWDAAIERDLSCSSFAQSIGEWFDLVEVLAASDAQLDEIASGIRAIRRRSPNPSLGIVVCGQIFDSRPEYTRLVGADLAASDPLSSLSQARSFLKTSSQAKSLITRQTEHRRLS